MYVVIVTRAKCLKTCSWQSVAIWLDSLLDRPSYLHGSYPAVPSKNKDFDLYFFRQFFFSSLVQLESSIEQLLNAPGCWAVFLIAVVIFNFLSLSRLLELKTESSSHADPVDNCLLPSSRPLWEILFD